VATGVKNENGGGSIYQSGGKWIAQTTDFDGRRRTRTCRSQNQGRRALRELLADRDRRYAGRLVPDEEVTVARILDVWWEEDFLGRVPQPVRGTRDAYSYCVVNLKRVLGPRRAAGLAVHEVTEAIKALSTTGRTSSGIMSRSYVSRHLNILSQAFDYAVAQERLGRNPAKQVKLPRTARAESTRKSFDLHQHARFIAAAQKHRWGRSSSSEPHSVFGPVR